MKFGDGVRPCKQVHVSVSEQENNIFVTVKIKLAPKSFFYLLDNWAGNFLRFCSHLRCCAKPNPLHFFVSKLAPICK